MFSALLRMAANSYEGDYSGWLKCVYGTFSKYVLQVQYMYHNAHHCVILIQP